MYFITASSQICFMIDGIWMLFLTNGSCVNLYLTGEGVGYPELPKFCRSHSDLHILLKAKEREDAKVLFKTRQGKDQLKEIKRRAKTFTPGEGEDGAAAAGGRPATNASGLTPEQVREANQIQLFFTAIRQGNSP